MNLMLVGTSRCDVPAREAAGGTVAPLHAAADGAAHRPYRFMVSNIRKSAPWPQAPHLQGCLTERRFRSG